MFVQILYCGYWYRVQPIRFRFVSSPAFQTGDPDAVPRVWVMDAHWRGKIATFAMAQVHCWREERI